MAEPRRARWFWCAVYFVPGAFGAGTTSHFLPAQDYFSEYREFFRARGCEVGRAEFPPDATIEVRGLTLRDQLTRFVGNLAMGGRGERTVTLVAHSQGALDARFALKKLGLVEANSLVSIGAPHQGTPFANWALRERERQGFWYWVLRTLGQYDLQGLAFATEMTPEFVSAHPDAFGAVPDIRYASAQGVCRAHCHWALRLADWVAGAEVGPGKGDGIVSRVSQKWGDDLGEFDLDHLSEVGTDSESRSERQRLFERIWNYLHVPH